MNFLESKLHSILEVAARVGSYLSWSSNTVFSVVESSAKKHNAIYSKENLTASDGYMFMLLCNDPKQLLLDIIEGIKGLKLKDKHINPVYLFTKLANKEYMLDLNGIRLCYALKVDPVSEAVLKAAACRHITMVRNFFNCIDPATNRLLDDKVKELHPDFSYMSNSITGGKSRPRDRKKENNFSYNQKKLRLTLISRLIEYVRNNSAIAKGIIFVNDISECETSAINIVFTDLKYKDAVSDYLKLLIETDFKDCSFKTFKHADFDVPYDFRMNKYSCMLNQKNVLQPLYIANLYNIGHYDPIPCIKQIADETFINVAHPLMKLRLLYIDVFMLEKKAHKTMPLDNNIFREKLLSAYEEVIQYQKTPNWVGFYKDEPYEKNKHNFTSGLQSSIEAHTV